MSGNSNTQFKLVEIDGYSEREIVAAPTLEELQAALGAKTGRAVPDRGEAHGD